MYDCLPKFYLHYSTLICNHAPDILLTNNRVDCGCCLFHAFWKTNHLCTLDVEMSWSCICMLLPDHSQWSPVLSLWTVKTVYIKSLDILALRDVLCHFIDAGCHPYSYSWTIACTQSHWHHLVCLFISWLDKAQWILFLQRMYNTTVKINRRQINLGTTVWLTVRLTSVSHSQIWRKDFVVVIHIYVQRYITDRCLATHGWAQQRKLH